MYLVLIGWLYVASMMAVAEATASNGTLLGALVTFVLYGVLPLALVLYLLGTPARRRERRRQEAAERQASAGAPDGGGHPPGAAQAPGVPPVREEP